MTVSVSCPRCGSMYPSRIRARDAAHFTVINVFAGPVLETCPRCGDRTSTGPEHRAWRGGSAPRPSLLRSPPG